MTQDPNMPGSVPPGSVPPPGATPPPGAPMGSPSDPYMGPPPTPDERTMAMICYITAIFGWLCWVGPLIFYVTRKDSAFLQDQSRTALNWALTVVIFFVAPLILFFCPPIAFLLIFAVGITNLVFCIIAAMKANQGIAYRFPFSIKFIR
jgi:uncharacterized Tic20 family protein